MLEGPAPSLMVRAKFWKEPEPEDGRVETITGGPEVDTVQVPVVVQGLNCEPLSPANPKILLAPLKPAVKPSGKLTVSVLPLMETEAAEAIRVQWLVVRVTEEPGASWQ